MSAPILYGTSSPIGGAPLSAAGCFMGTLTVTGASPGMPVVATPQSTPTDGTFWFGFVSATNTVTILLCNAQAGYVPAIVFNVAVFNSGGSAGGPTLETNGVVNTLQSLLNLIAGTNVTLTADGAGGVTIAATGGTGTVTHTAGALTADEPVFGNGGGDVKVGTKSGNTDELATVSSTGASGHMATWDGSGNLQDGGAPAAGTVTNTAGALTANEPVFGNGGADVKVGTKSGNTDELATVTSTGASGHLTTWDGSGNLQDGGAPPATPPTTQSVVTGSRVFGTTYQNTTGKMLFVSVTAIANATGGNLQGLSDANPIPTQVVTLVSLNLTGFGVSIFWMVPAGFYYQATTPAGWTLNEWIEWN